jgi:hypothetical protein
VVPILPSDESVTSSNNGERSVHTTTKSSLLVEYARLGDGTRSEHLQDTDNRSFRELRIVDPNDRRSQKYVEYYCSNGNPSNCTKLGAPSQSIWIRIRHEMNNTVADASREL